MNDKIAELTALLAKATPGPVGEVGAEIHDRHGYHCSFFRQTDAVLYVAMRNALPELLVEMHRQRKETADLNFNLHTAGTTIDQIKTLKNAALTRAEKAEAARFNSDTAYELALNALEQVKAERDWLAEQCENLALTKKEVWLEEAAQEAAKRVGETK